MSETKQIRCDTMNNNEKIKNHKHLAKKNSLTTIQIETKSKHQGVTSFEEHCWRWLKQLLGLLVPIVVLLLACFGTAILATTDMFNSSITQRLVISNTSETFSLWQRPPVHPLLKMFIFNYTNVDNFKDGIDGKLNVQEVGPYIYSETVEKVNIVFNDDSTLTFQENRTYQFLPEKSAGSEDDLIITPSIPLISADNELRKYHLNYFARFMVSATLRKIEPFRDLRVQDFLWGYDDPVYETAKTLAAFLNPLPYEKFGILVARNGLSEDRVTMHSGVDDMSKLGIISRFNGIQELSHWGTAECNRIDGTDGTLYPVNQVSPNNILHVFNHDLCRRFPLIFEKNVETKEGIPALRFHAPRNVFDNPSTNPDNMCYCNEPSIPCLPAGVFNVSPCAFGAPIMLSFPHFFLGDPVLTDIVNGLQPDPSKHDMYVDMHEKLGVPIRGQSRFQINIAVGKNPSISILENFGKEVILPIAWFELGLDELPDQIQDILYHVTFSAHKIQLALQVILGLAIIFSATSLIIRIAKIIRINYQYNKNSPLEAPSIHLQNFLKPNKT